MSDIANIDPKTTRVATVNNPKKYHFGCIKCRKIHASGTWVVGVLIGERRFLVGKDPPVRCCGEEKKICEVFDDEAPAAALRDRIIEHLLEKKTTEGLMLYETAWISAEDSGKVH